MNDIFSNAYFGKTYKTRDGRKAIYLGEISRDITDSPHKLAISESLEIFVMDNGRFEGRKDDYCWDIVSEWSESINEEELDKLAENERLWYRYDNENCSHTIDDNVYIEAFKAGYRNALNR